MSVPYWVEDAVFYQIFPDRFSNGDPTNDLPGMDPWGSAPTGHGFQGGDLRGIIQNIDYLLDLGVNAVYLNPIFQSPSNHGYNTADYFKINSRLGTLHDFHALIEVAHQNDIKIILDGVFNHCGRGFFAFNDLVENLARREGVTVFICTHNLVEAQKMCDRVAVMYLGKIVETTTTAKLYSRPAHPYTSALLSAAPIPDPLVERDREKIVLVGDPPTPSNPPSGCRFRTRCWKAQALCAEVEPPLEAIEDGHRVACHFPLWEPDRT